MSALIRPALVLFLLLTAITGIAYPLIVTGVARIVFPDQAGGSIIVRGGKPVGSRLIGQNFSAPKYFWSRPSATSPQPYNGVASSGSNLGPLNPALTERIKNSIDALRAADPTATAPVPVDLVTASGSGLDPELSLAGARYQVARVARARGLPQGVVQSLLDAHARGKWLGLFGEPRVNVLELNLALEDRAIAKH
jgi:potassium-transporting ATPase KdpC subunit